MRNFSVKSIGFNSDYLKAIPLIIGVLCRRIPSDIFHMHDCTELWYALSGEAIHRIGNEIYVQKPGSCVAVPSFTAHDIYTSESEDTPIFLSIHVSDNALQSRGYNYFSYGGGKIFYDGKYLPIYHQFSGEELEQANEIAHSLSDEFSKHKKLNSDKLISLYVNFLNLLGGEPCSFKLKSSIIERANLILSATNYIMTHYKEKITTKELCDLTYMSRSRFCEYFTDITGVSPTYFLKCIRMTVAQCEYMLRGKKLSEIVELIGVYDKAQLARLFKQHYGMTMSEFRKERQNYELEFDYISRMRQSNLEELNEFFKSKLLKNN